MERVESTLMRLMPQHKLRQHLQRVVKGSQGVYEKSISIAEHRALKKATSGKPRTERSPTVNRFAKTA